MDIIKSLLPGTWSPFEAFARLNDPATTLAGITDLFIHIVSYSSGLLLVVVIALTIRTWIRTNRYRAVLSNLEGGYASIRSRWLDPDKRPLAAAFDSSIVEVPRSDDPLEREYRRTVDSQEIFNESTLARGLIGNRLFNAMPGLLTGLGVLGTFIGLRYGIGSLELGGDQLEDLDNSITPLIKGSSTAFATSVWGVLASLVFAVCEKVLEMVARFPIHKLQHTLDSAIPRYTPEGGIIELHRATASSEAILKGLAVAIGEQMQKAIDSIGESVVKAVGDALEGSAGDLSSQSANLMSEALSEELGRLKQAMVDMADGFSSQFNGANAQLQQTVTGLETIISTLESSVNQSGSSVTTAVERLDSHNEVMTEFSKTVGVFDQATERFSEMKDSFTEAAVSQRAASESADHAAGVNRDVADKFSVVGEKLPHVEESISKAAEIIASIGVPILDLKALLENTPQIFENQAKAQEQSATEREKQLLEQTTILASKVAEAADQFSQVSGLSQALGESATELNNASSNLQELSDNIRGASNDQVEAAKASRDAALAGKDVAQSLAPLPNSFSGAVGMLDKAGTSLKDGADSAAAAYREAMSHQKLWLEGIESGLRAMRDRIQEIMEQFGNSVEGETKTQIQRWTKAVSETLEKFSIQTNSLEGAIDELTALLEQKK